MNPTPTPSIGTLRLPWLNRAALRYWSFHVCISAAPSFIYMLDDRSGLPCIVGMLLGVGFFIGLYTVCARWTYPGKSELPLWRRAMRMGTWIRTGSVLLLPTGACLHPLFDRNPFAFLFMPDFFAGMLALSLTEEIGRLPFLVWLRPLVPDPGGVLVSEMSSVVPTFLTTVIEGVILSGLLFLIAFACLGILRCIAHGRPPLPPRSNHDLCP